MFIRNAWYIAARSAELGREPLPRMLLGEPVVLYRKQDGSPVALEDRCCHRRAPLSKGRVEGDSLRCGYHGFVYDSGGRCTWVPGTNRIPPNAMVRSYAVVERYRWVWIWAGDPAHAEASAIPDLHYNDASGWASAESSLAVKADYLLLVENLLDLSHLPFVHINSIGAADDTDAELVWERVDSFVRGTRVTTNISPSHSMISQGIDFKLDQKQVMTFLPPCHVLIEVTRTESTPPPGRPPRVVAHFFILSSMTPETATSCRYYWANTRDFKVEDAQLTAMLLRLVSSAFEEDREIIEAQQRIIELDQEAPTVNVVGDAGGVQARRLIARLLEEQERAARLGVSVAQ